LHFHGLVACHRFGRLTESLVGHFEKNEGIYLTEKISEIDVARIGTGVRFKPTEYGLKGILNQRFDADDLLILPASLGELLRR